MITKVGMKDNSLTTTVGFIAFLTWHSNSNLFSSSEWQVLTTDWNVSHTGQPINQVKRQVSVWHYFAQTGLQFKRGHWFLVVLPLDSAKSSRIAYATGAETSLSFWAAIAWLLGRNLLLHSSFEQTTDNHCYNCHSLLCHLFGYNPGCWI